MSFEVTVPWPCTELWPNRKAHWSRLAGKKKAYRTLAHGESLLANGKRFKADRVKATITFIEPDNIRRDTDNMIAAIKGAIDGVADCVGVDDSKWDMTFKRSTLRCKPGSVTIALEAIDG